MRLAIIVLLAMGFATPAMAGDFFDDLAAAPFASRYVAKPPRVVVPAGLPISIALPSLPPGASLGRTDFKHPASTATARAGIDPFTGRALP